MRWWWAENKSPIFFEDSAEFTTAKVNLYIDDGVLVKAKMKVSFLPSFYKTCSNFIKD